MLCLYIWAAVNWYELLCRPKWLTWKALTNFIHYYKPNENHFWSSLIIASYFNTFKFFDLKAHHFPTQNLKCKLKYFMLNRLVLSHPAAPLLRPPGFENHCYNAFMARNHTDLCWYYPKPLFALGASKLLEGTVLIFVELVWTLSEIILDTSDSLLVLSYTESTIEKIFPRQLQDCHQLLELLKRQDGSMDLCCLFLTLPILYCPIF